MRPILTRTGFINNSDINNKHSPCTAVLPYLHCMMHYRGQIMNPPTGVETILLVTSVEFYACLPRLPDLGECSNNTM